MEDESTKVFVERGRESDEFREEVNVRESAHNDLQDRRRCERGKGE